jgi:hypothetical protein
MEWYDSCGLLQNNPRWKGQGMVGRNKLGHELTSLKLLTGIWIHHAVLLKYALHFPK